MKKLLLFVLMGLSISAFPQLQEESFEGEWPPQGWGIYNVSGPNVTWNQLAASVFPAFWGSKMAYLAQEDVAQGTTEDWLITKRFVVQPGSVLKFYSRLLMGGNQGNTFKVMISTNPDQGSFSSYIQLMEWNETQLNPYQTSYNEVAVPIPASFTGNEIYIAFVMHGDSGDSWFIDDVSTTNCDQPVNLTVNSITETTASVSWVNPSLATAWEVEVVPAGFQPTYQGTPVNTIPYIITSLTAGNYSVYVRAMCPASPSIWAGPLNFQTGAATSGNVISGIVRYDLNNDQVCDTEDIHLPSIPVEVTLGSMTYQSYTNAAGQYVVYNVPDSGSITLKPILPAPFPAVAPVTYAINPIDNHQAINLCIPAPASQVTNISVAIVPVMPARPGFNSGYSIRITNNGTTTINSGALTLTFNDTKLDFTSATPPNTVSANTVSFPVSNLQPFSTQVKDIVFSVLPPPENIGGEVLVYNAVMSGVSNYGDMVNASTVLNQTIVNSYDPNDITVHEGPFITEAQANGELTYTIRFQNTGTADAVNIRLNNQLHEDLNWGTLRVVGSSHDAAVSRTGSVVTFRFNDIHLPPASSNEAGSHGYVTYKIKPNTTFGIGHVISNMASIYFDFNAPIITNTVTTQIQTMSTDAFTAGVARVYPNPATDTVTIDVTDGELLSAEVFDINGRKCNVQVFGNTLNVQQLHSGIYLLKVCATQGNTIFKLMKQ